jgi:glyceraldehyde 3-phosphate dehydrogenase
MSQPASSEALGINGLGRIGKLTLWHHAARRFFPRIVVNLGREAGRDLETVCQTIEKDSTYGSMHRFLFGVNAEPCVKIVDRDQRLLTVAGTPVQVLQEARNPRDIGWKERGARIVVDTTGVFGDPTDAPGAEKGALRGHLEAGAEKVLYSAAFKIKDKSLELPDDSVLLIYGINHDQFDPARHHLISAASCTTTALAHMVKPILDRLRYSNMLTAAMSTVHAVTNSQSVLDNVPKAGAKDLRRTRSILNNIILTSTNAAAALERVLPQIRDIGFMADSVRVPLLTESLIILNVTFQSRLQADGEPTITREVLNEIYRTVAEGEQKGLLVYSDEQNVSADVSGMKAAVVIEGVETHTRTGFVNIDLSTLPGLSAESLAGLEASTVRVPVTHAKVCGWYDNEYGSYTNLLGDLTVHVREQLD